jgi:predicted DNA-binding ribbon-helix-helix protein
MKKDGIGVDNTDNMYYLCCKHQTKGGENVGSYTLKEVDDKLWRKVKSLAALRGMTIKDLIIDLLEKEVKKGE